MGCFMSVVTCDGLDEAIKEKVAEAKRVSDASGMCKIVFKAPWEGGRWFVGFCFFPLTARPGDEISLDNGTCGAWIGEIVEVVS